MRCFGSEQGLARFWAGATIPETVRQSERFRRRTADLARRCGRVSGALLGHVSTADTARDLDHLRALLGERRISFLGLSYGTFVGQTYASLFPARVRAMVLDGVVDAPSWVRGAESRLQAVVSPSDAVFERFASLCQAAGPARCAVARRGPVAAGFRRLLARLRRGPIAAPHASPPGELTYSDLLLSLFSPLRDPAVWPKLGADLAAAEGGDGSALETAARRMRTPAGWSAVTTSAAIQCADGAARRRSRDWPAVIGRLEHISRLQGLVQGWWLWAPCTSWPTRAPGRYAGPWGARTRTPILLIGTRHDPNTAYANARRAVRRLGHAVLLTHDGYGHLSTTDPSACIERAESAYLVGLVVPRPGTVCASDRQPFNPEFGQPLP